MIKRYAKIAFSVFMLILIITGGKRFMENLNIGDLSSLLRSFSPFRIASFAAAGLFAVWFTFLYDFTVLRSMGIHIGVTRIMKTALIATAFNNIAGFGGVGGATARILLYKNKGVPDREAQRISLYIIPAAITGLGFLMLLNLLGITRIREFIAAYRWIYFLMTGFILYVPVYCWFTDIKGSVLNTDVSQRARDKGTKLRIRLSIVSSLDLLAAGSVFAFITSNITGDVSALQSIGIFSVAAATGIVSMIPAGAGSFDLMLVNGLLIFGAESHEAVAALLLFRFFYYAVPALTGLLLSAGELSGLVVRRKR